MNILIVGGTAQGKTEIARECFGAAASRMADGETVEFDQLNGATALNRLHLLIRRMLQAGCNPEQALADWRAGRDGWLVLCDEIGGGIVPVDALERRWREVTGRICCDLAAEADVVLRVHCGLAQVLKGREP